MDHRRASAYAMGPSRVNPTTGQILDADIIFDADFLQYWKQEHETFTPGEVALMTGGPIDLEQYRAEMKRRPAYMHESNAARSECQLLGGMSHQFAVGASVMAARRRSPAEMEKLIMQGLKECTMHEVGHTLGLAHNFRASGYYSLADLNDTTKTAETGLGMSVMDYNPVNISPTDMKQGDYFSQTIGPYDIWAIEYGYKPLPGGSPEAELPALKKIASRSGDPRYAYASDGNARGIDPDPLTARYDLSNDIVAYAKEEAKLVAESWPKIVDELTERRRRLPKGAAGVQHAAGATWRSDVRGGPLRGWPQRQPQPQGRRKGRRSRSWSSRPRSSAKRSRWWKNRSSATSRSVSRRSSTDTWPRRNGITGVPSRSSGPTIRPTK